MQQYRIGSNDYVMSTTTGARELLFVSSNAQEQHFVVEQARHRMPVTDGTTYHLESKIRRPAPNKDLFVQSMTAVSRFAERLDEFNTPRMHVTRLQFRPQASVKWAPYKCDGLVFFMPYTVEILRLTDIVIKSDVVRPKLVVASETEVIKTLNEE